MTEEQKIAETHLRHNRDVALALKDYNSADQISRWLDDLLHKGEIPESYRHLIPKSEEANDTAPEPTSAPSRGTSGWEWL